MAYCGEMVIRFFDWLQGQTAFHATRIIMTHGLIHSVFRARSPRMMDPSLYSLVYDSGKEFVSEESLRYFCNGTVPFHAHAVQLFNIADDPEERVNVAADHLELVCELMRRVQAINAKRPQTQLERQKLRLPYRASRRMHATGNCSMNERVPSHHCYFKSPWLSKVYRYEVIFIYMIN
jgi:hypothetical protein